MKNDTQNQTSEVSTETDNLRAKKVKGDFLKHWEMAGDIRTRWAFKRSDSYPYEVLRDDEGNRIKEKVSDFQRDLETLLSYANADEPRYLLHYLTKFERTAKLLPLLDQFLIQEGSTLVMSSSIQGNPEYPAQVRVYEVHPTTGFEKHWRLTDVLPKVCKWSRRVELEDVEHAKNLISENYNRVAEIRLLHDIQVKKDRIERNKSMVVHETNRFVKDLLPEIKAKIESLEKDTKKHDRHLKQLNSAKKYFESLEKSTYDIEDAIGSMKYMHPEHILRKLKQSANLAIERVDEGVKSLKLDLLDAYYEEVGQYIPNDYQSLADAYNHVIRGE